MSTAEGQAESWKEESNKLWKENDRLQKIMKEQTDSEAKWVRLVEDLEGNVKKTEQTNAELQAIMEVELKKMKEETEKNCHDILNSKRMRMVEEKDNEMRLLKLQMSKQKQTDNEEETDMQEAVRK